MAAVSIADQLKVLVDLQRIDGEIFHLRRQLEAKPAEAARLKEEHQRFTQGLQQTEARYRALEVKRNQRETDLGQKEEQIKRLQVQLFQVKTNKEYSAMQREIEGFRADKSVLEEEVLRIMEEIDGAKALVVAEREQLKTRETELKSRLDGIEQESQGIQASIEELKGKRGAVIPKVDPGILSQYERILERKEGLALVPVIGGSSCGGCHMILPPQTVNEVQMNTRLVPCESCARILYVETNG